MPSSTRPDPGYHLAHTVSSGPGPTVALPQPEIWPIPITREPGRTARAEATCGTCGMTLEYRLFSTSRTRALRAMWAVLLIVTALCCAVTAYLALAPGPDGRPSGALLFLGLLAAPGIAFLSGRQFFRETGLRGPGRWIGHKGHALHTGTIAKNDT
ncbi:hypothetical protein [Nocardiopsis ansamitocini]|uniref:Uncharacterized protein n=1 Tax=Nocardiopsis ansamitocini TaxID=1670832 RepID=A0A9W6PAN8_9ACTN|nr:hypothetical protein [Nocardiopsis ansamitocini]GLU50083.1 hypothetical protein Nans01_44340 [Nocardiopsis ansamitocini]